MGKLHPEASIVKEAGEGIGRHFFKVLFKTLE